MISLLKSVFFSDCGGNLTFPSGFLETPFFPNEYPSQLRCEWLITAPTGHQIELKVLNFSLEVGVGCVEDYLEIRNGMTSESPLIGSFCGETIPRLIPSFTNHLYIIFQSDIAIESNGFRIEYEQTSTGCGGKLDSPEGSIHSPHYPAVVTDSMQCDWYITVNHGSVIDFNITGHESLCNSGALILYDNEDLSRSLKLNCSNGRIISKSETNVVHVRYTSREGDDIKSFLLEYKINCKTVLEQPFGIIESPNFPGDYPPNAACEWKVISPKGHTIKISISHLSLESDPQLPDYLEIIDMKGEEEIKRAKYDRKPSTDVTTVGNIALIKFVSDFYVGNMGFRLEFTRQGCGGKIGSSAGNFITPNMPYSADVDCEWFIETKPGSTIVLMIKEIQMDTDTGDCNSNALIVANSKSDENVLFKACREVEKMETTIVSDGKFSTGKCFFVCFVLKF